MALQSNMSYRDHMAITLCPVHGSCRIVLDVEVCLASIALLHPPSPTMDLLLLLFVFEMRKIVKTVAASTEKNPIHPDLSAYCVFDSTNKLHK